MKKLGEILVQDRVIEPARLEAALELQRSKPLRLGRLLQETDAITEPQLLRALSQQLSLPFKPALQQDPDLALPAGLRREFLEHYLVVPLAVSGEELIIAVNDPLETYAVDALSMLFGLPATLVLTGREEITSAIKRLFAHADEQEVIRLWDLSNEDFPASGREAVDEILSSSSRLPPVIRMVNLMMLEAAREEASDIHLESSVRGFRIRYRIDGILYDVHTPPKRVSAAMIARVKVMAGLNVAEKRKPQDGRIRIRTREHDLDIRAATIPAADGERVVLRLLDRARALLPLSAVGLNEDHAVVVGRLLSHPSGMILITGPTGSGKTTTLYGMLNQLNTGERNIITIEDPIEYRLEGISQLPVNPHAGFTFANGLRSILRQDPDVIMVGEIRDRETAEIAIQAAMTGHLVLSTLHTNTAIEAVNRLREMGIAPYLIADSVTAVISQRLIRQVCPNCKKPATLPASLPPDFAAQLDTPADARLFIGAGCHRCRGTGYKGRTGIFELVEFSATLRELLHRGESALAIEAHLQSIEYKTLRYEGIRKALLGATTIDEVLRISRQE